MRRRMLLAAAAAALAMPAAPAMADDGSGPSNTATSVAANVSVNKQEAEQYGFFTGSQFLSQSAFTNQYASSYANAEQYVIVFPWP